MVRVVKGNAGEIPNTWQPIPYPVGFNSSNSAVTISSLGKNLDNVTFKMNSERTQYAVIKINNTIYYQPYFIFIKIN